MGDSQEGYYVAIPISREYGEKLTKIARLFGYRRRAEFLRRLVLEVIYYAESKGLLKEG